jgi:6-phosphofructokinase
LYLSPNKYKIDPFSIEKFQCSKVIDRYEIRDATCQTPETQFIFLAPNSPYPEGTIGAILNKAADSVLQYPVYGLLSPLFPTHLSIPDPFSLRRNLLTLAFFMVFFTNTKGRKESDFQTPMSRATRPHGLLWNQHHYVPVIAYECNEHGGITMAITKSKKGVIAILTGGGDVPGLNPAIRAVTLRAIHEGYQVIGLRRGWAGITDMVRDTEADNRESYQVLTEEIVNKAGRTGGTFLHTSRTRPSHIPRANVPPHLQDTYTEEKNDLTPEILKNLEFLGIDYLIPIGGDDTLSYGVRLYQEGVKVVAIPKTMDNDVPGTEYCIGFSTCVTRTIMMTNSLRTTAGSHERFLVLEVFGRYAGFTAMLPTMAGAANRCVIPEYKFDIEKLTELLAEDRYKNPSKYSIVLVSEGAMFEGGEMVFQDMAKDAYGHAKLGGIGDLVSAKLKELSPKYNNGKPINVISQKLGYIVRGGDPDACDSVVPMAYGNLALDLILKGIHGRLVVLKNGRYDNVPIDVVTSSKKVVNVKKHYNTERLRPLYQSFEMQPLFIMTSEA